MPNHGGGAADQQTTIYGVELLTVNLGNWAGVVN